MAYSHLRLRKTLALIRILMGVIFLFLGAHKISSWEFARIEFPQFISEATHGAAVGFYGDLLNSVIWNHPSGYALLVGLTELFLGVGLSLGLAVRPVSLVGMLYTANLILATAMAPGEYAPLWRYLDNEIKLIVVFFLFLLLGIGHAGENWGLGALYHRRRHQKWEEEGKTLEGERPEEPRSETYRDSYGAAEEELAEDEALYHHSKLRQIKM